MPRHENLVEVLVDDASEDGASLQLRTGHMARFADAAVVASRGETDVRTRVT